MKRFLKNVHTGFFKGGVVFFFVMFYPFLRFYSHKRINFRAMHRLRYWLGLLSSTTAGIVYRYHYEEPIDWSKPYIICPNHTSNLDILAATLFIKSHFAFLGKDELLNNPVTGLFFKTIDIPLNRESKISSFRAFKRGEEYLKQGISLVIFPEGRIDELYPPKVHPFKNGPFRLAIEQKIAIIPVTMVNNWRIMWDDGYKYGSRPGICDIWVHKPIETGTLEVETADALRDQVYEIINNKFKEYEAKS